MDRPPGDVARARAAQESHRYGDVLRPAALAADGLDPFKPRAMMNETQEEFGERVTMVVIPNAIHALMPEQPAAVVDAIVKWIGTLPRQP